MWEASEWKPIFLNINTVSTMIEKKTFGELVWNIHVLTENMGSEGGKEPWRVEHNSKVFNSTSKIVSLAEKFLKNRPHER